MPDWRWSVNIWQYLKISALFGLLPETGLASFVSCRLGPVRHQNHARDQHSESPQHGLAPGLTLTPHATTVYGHTRMRWFEVFETWQRTKFETKLDNNEKSDKLWASRESAQGFRKQPRLVAGAVASSADLTIGCLQQRRLPEQGQHALLRLVGLGQHGGGGLRDDLRLGQGGRLFRVVGVHDPAA